MSRPRKHPDELMQRVRLGLESGRPISHITADLGMPPETLRKRVRQAEVDNRARPDLPTGAERDEIRKLRAENLGLPGPNEILKPASAITSSA